MNEQVGSSGGFFLFNFLNLVAEFSGTPISCGFPFHTSYGIIEITHNSTRAPREDAVRTFCQCRSRFRKGNEGRKCLDALWAFCIHARGQRKADAGFSNEMAL